MQESYSKNYIKIYFFQFLSIILGFFSLFVVVPYLSSDQSTYGIYSVCISIMVFLSYADLGFLGAGQKYAAESFSRGDKKQEMELIGFSHFILLVFVLLLSCFFFFLSLYPELLINGLDPSEQYIIARRLLIVLAVFAPVTVLQRMGQMIFSIRLQEYNIQKINIVGSSVKILSVFYFFGRGTYDIISYFLFMQVVNLLCASIVMWQAKRKYNYDIILLLKSVKFNYSIFSKVKHLALSSLAVTVAWILYYELDSFAIGKMLGATDVAIYAIGFTILTFFRTMIGVVFSPFSARFNHFVGMGLFVELRQFIQYVMLLTFPIVVFPVVAVAIFSEALIFSWVGVEYKSSVSLMSWLVLCNVFAFVSYPVGLLLVAIKRLKEMYLISFLMPLIYWAGIFSTISIWGVESFSIFKFIAFFVSSLFYLTFVLKYINVSLRRFFLKNILPYLPAFAIMVVILFLFKDTWVGGKDKLNLLINVLFLGITLCVAMGISLLTVKPLRIYVGKISHIILKRI